jgi:hypothetical protein
MNYESAPNGVSYEALLKVIESRTTIGKPYEERLYLVALTNTLVNLSKKTTTDTAEIRDKRSDWGNLH